MDQRTMAEPSFCIHFCVRYLFLFLFHDGIRWYTTDFFSVNRVLCGCIRNIRIVILCFRERTVPIGALVESWS